jgi:hypothetical protein
MTLRVAIDGKDREAMADLVRTHGVDVVRTTVARHNAHGFRVDALLEADRVEQLRAAGYGVHVIEDAEEVSASRRADIDWHPEDRPRGRRPSRPPTA